MDIRGLSNVDPRKYSMLVSLLDVLFFKSPSLFVYLDRPVGVPAIALRRQWWCLVRILWDMKNVHFFLSGVPFCRLTRALTMWISQLTVRDMLSDSWIMFCSTKIITAHSTIKYVFYLLKSFNTNHSGGTNYIHL